jgi:large subunit ribosomal protein L10
MNREQKAAAIEEISREIEEAQAIFAVDYRGISVPQAAELRVKLRDANASFRVVKNSLTERAADNAGAEQLKQLLQGPTALTFVRGDAAVAAKAVADYARATSLLPFKGGLMDGQSLDAQQIGQIARLPSRDVLYGQLVGLVASPIGGLVRTLNALIGGLAIALGQVAEKKESGEIPAGEAPASEAPASEAPASEAPAAEPPPAEGGSTAGAPDAAAAPTGASDADTAPTGAEQAAAEGGSTDDSSATAAPESEAAAPEAVAQENSTQAEAEVDAPAEPAASEESAGEPPSEGGGSTAGASDADAQTENETKNETKADASAEADDNAAEA